MNAPEARNDNGYVGNLNQPIRQEDLYRLSHDIPIVELHLSEEGIADCDGYSPSIPGTASVGMCLGGQKGRGFAELDTILQSSPDIPCQERKHADLPELQPKGRQRM